MSRLRTPIIKPRTQGGTFYTFGSALEDVGLNINELKNKVTLSHYVLLNIPAFEVSEFKDNVNKGDYTFAQSFQNYALNMETVLRNQSSYNFAESATVSERVFWKWMQKEKLISFVNDVDEDDNDTGYYIDASTFNDDSVIKGFGLISAGAQRTDAYGIYNETFVQIPSSYGQMKVLLKPVSDKNYYMTKNGQAFSASDQHSIYIENVDASTECDSSGNLHTGLSAIAIFDDDSTRSYKIEDNKDELCVEFSLGELRKYYDDDTLSYNDIGVGDSSIIRPLEVNGNFEFNSVLVYYSIYDSTGKNILATNAYGLLLLDSAELKEENKYQYPSFPKKQSGVNDAGNSYSFRLNIKTSSVYNGDIKVTDNSTPAYSMSEDFNDTIKNLGVAVETLRSNANLISVLSDQNTSIKELVVRSLDKIDDIENDIVNLKTGKAKEIKTASLITDALSANTLDSSLEIGDYGTFDGSVFSYTTVKTDLLDATDASIDKLTTTVIKGKHEEILFDKYGKISSNGLFANTVYLDSKTSEADRMSLVDANTILNSLNPKKDGNILIDSTEASTTDTADNIGIYVSDSEVSDKNGLNIKPLLGAIIIKLKSLELFDISTVDSSTDILLNIYDTINIINDAYQSLYEEFSLLQSRQESLEYDSSLLSTHMEEIDSSIEAINSTLNDYNNAFEDIDNTLYNISDDVSTLIDNYNVIDTRTTDLETAVNNIDSSLAMLNTLDASIKAHDTSIQSQNTIVNDLSTNVNAFARFIGENEMSQYGSLRELIADIVEHGA